MIGFVVGFITALALIIGITVIPIILAVILIFLAYGWYRSKKETKF